MGFVFSQTLLLKRKLDSIKGQSNEENNMRKILIMIKTIFVCVLIHVNRCVSTQWAIDTMVPEIDVLFQE